MSPLIKIRRYWTMHLFRLTLIDTSNDPKSNPSSAAWSQVLRPAPMEGGPETVRGGQDRLQDTRGPHSLLPQD